MSTTLTLRIRDLAVLLAVLESRGFGRTYELPHERLRLIDRCDVTVAVGFDGKATIYGGSVRECEALIAAMAEAGGVTA